MRKTLVMLLSLFTALAILAPGAAAQSGDEIDPENRAYLRVANFRTDGVGIDLYVDDEPGETANLEADAVSTWAAVPAGAHNVAVVDTGATPDTGAMEPLDVELQPGQWITLVVTGSAQAGTLRALPVEIPAQDMMPGTAMMTFVNALSGETRVNFDRDGVPFVTELAPPGNADGLRSDTSTLVDAGTYTFSAYPTTEPDNLIGELDEVTIVETSYYLLAVVEGAEGPALVMDETRFAELLIARGDLEAPGTVLDAARANDLLVPFVQALEATGVADELTGEGPYTVFAPADFAVEGALSRFGSDTEALANWLRGYIVEGDLKFGDVWESESLTSLTGETLQIEPVENTATVNGAEILTPNLAAMNGTLHIIGASPAG